MTLAIVSAILQIFGMFLVGWLARHFGYIRAEDLNPWSNLVIDVFMPALVFHSIVRDFQADRIGEVWVLPATGFALVALGGLAGFVLRLGTGERDSALARTFHHFCAANNYAFLPIIILHQLWGDGAVARLFLMNVGSTVGYWTIGVGVLGGVTWRSALRHTLSPSLVALALALAICLLGGSHHLPAVAMNVFGSVGAAAVPCILVLVGAGLYPFPDMRRKGLLAYFCLVRLVALPALTVLGLALVPLTPEVRNIAIVVALMPASVSSTILVRRYGGDADFAASAAVVSTLVSLATVPLGLALLLH